MPPAALRGGTGAGARARNGQRACLAVRRDFIRSTWHARALQPSAPIGHARPGDALPRREGPRAMQGRAPLMQVTPPLAQAPATAARSSGWHPRRTCAPHAMHAAHPSRPAAQQPRARPPRFAPDRSSSTPPRRRRDLLPAPQPRCVRSTDFAQLTALSAGTAPARRNMSGISCLRRTGGSSHSRSSSLGGMGGATAAAAARTASRRVSKAERSAAPRSATPHAAPTASRLAATSDSV